VSGALSILHVVDSLERGGLERNVCDIAQEQRQAGHHPAVFCLYRLGELAAELMAAGIHVQCAHKRDGFDLRPFLSLRSALLQTRWDIVHSHNLVPNYYVAVATLGMSRTRRPVVVNSCHDMGTRLGRSGLRRRYLWSVRRTSHIVMVADEVRDRYVGGGLIPASKASVVYNGVRTDCHQAGPAGRVEARAVLALGSQVQVIGTVGRLVPVKNQALLLRCMADLLRSADGLHLVLVGGGPLEGALRAQCDSLGIREHVTFAGERSDVARLLPAFDVFVLPSLTEGLSIALLEAASAGLAIVATDVGGNGRIVQHDLTGLLVPSEDQAALGSAITTLLESEPMRHRLGEAARQWAVDHASIQAQCRSLQSVYERTLRDSARKA